MSDPSEKLHNIDFDNLILESEQDSELDDTLSESTQTKARRTPRLVVIFTWIASLLVGVLITMDSPHPTERIGTRSADVQLGVALYHLAHRVESYQERTGSLPDYLEPDWQESAQVEYSVVDGQYQLVARAGKFVRKYSQGQDPETLLFGEQQ